SWQETQRITNGIGEKKNFWPDIAVDSSEYPHVVWGHYAGTGSELDYWIQYSRYNGISWTSPVDILRIEGKHMACGRIAIDSEDHPHVVAEKWNYDGIYYTRYNGETWSEPYLIYEGSHAGRPDITIEPSTGLGCVVWGCRYYRFFNDTIWDSAGCIVGPDGVLPSLTAGIGTFHLVWASGDIWYSEHTVTGIESLEDSLQKEIELKCIPNPFNPGIMVQFALLERIGVVIKVYNALGQEVKVLVNDILCSGPYEVVWDGKGNLGRTVPCGVYFLRFTTGEYIATQKLLKVR
ncbi:T9SS type A sorting domain-containing protein, partial [candidate division WOR-3 bacterium]|nr:T9SS type A sorting domain-containing protein [candidate division WOR-3 bacterium]